MKDLPSKYRLVLILRFIDELSYETIAEKCQLPISTAKVQVHRALLILRKAIKSYD
jgi:RNA polymerase sigma-70 factor (ECF subfamily)